MPSTMDVRAGMNAVRIDLLDSTCYMRFVCLRACVCVCADGCDPSCLLCTYLSYYWLWYGSIQEPVFVQEKRKVSEKQYQQHQDQEQE